MSPSDRASLGKLVTDVLGFYRQPVSDFTLQVWLLACEPFELEQVRKAMTAHATDPERGQFPPKPADIVRQLAGTPTDRAAVAWGKVFEAMHAVGAYTDVVFDDPAIHVVIEDLGGWPKLCRTASDELGLMQHKFQQAHQAYTRQGTFAYPRRLAGDRSADHDYERRGIPLPRPALIGERRSALAVLEHGSTSGRVAIGQARLGELAQLALSHSKAALL